METQNMDQQRTGSEPAETEHCKNRYLTNKSGGTYSTKWSAEEDSII